MFRRRIPPVRLFLHRSDGMAVRRECSPRALDALVSQILERGGGAAAKSWKRADQFDSSQVLAAWPDALPRPERALLGRGSPGNSGAWLEAAFGPGVALQELVEDLERYLLGQEACAPVIAEVEALCQPEPHRAPEPIPAPLPVAALRARTTPQVLPTFPTPVREGDLFTLAVSGLSGGQLDLGMEVREVDLPGLNPGDRLISPRRGICTILQLDLTRAQAVLRDESDRNLSIDFAELIAEFSFDDEESEFQRK